MLISCKSEAKIPAFGYERINAAKIFLDLGHDVLHLILGPRILVEHITAVPLPHFPLQFS